jgi:hypothetical protein
VDFSKILLGSSRILEKYNMPCHAMHPIQDLFLESFSYLLQFDMHFICTPMWTKKFILVKSGCYKFIKSTQTVG